MRRWAGWAAILCMVGKCVASAAATAPAPGDAIWEPGPGPLQDPAKVFDPIMQKALATHGSPGATLAIAYHGRLVYAKGYGLADVVAGKPVLPETPFLLASVSKIITAQAILQLVQDGRLHFSDKVFPLYFPDVKPPPGRNANPKYHAITLRDLLVHAGGWDRNASGEPRSHLAMVEGALHVRPPVTMEQLMSYMLAQPLDFTPGTQQVYSNFGYGILGLLIERVSGEKYADFCRERVLEPAGMRHTVFHIANNYLPGESRRYDYQGKQIPNDLPPLPTGADGWICPASDITLLLGHISGAIAPALLPASLCREMLAPPQPPLSIRANKTWYGLGWDSVAATPYGYNYEKNGTVLGDYTFARHEAAGFDIVLMFNGAKSSDDSQQEIAEGMQQVTEALLKNAFAWPPSPPTRPSNAQ